MKTETVHHDTKAAKRTYWSNHINQWERSGETQRQYCRHHTLVCHQFTYWKQRLRPSTKKNTGSGGFVAVPQDQPSAPYIQEITLHLPNGCRIEGIRADNLTLIRDVMRWAT